jgi:hypothetical protein
MAVSASLEQIRDSILDRLRYPSMTGQMLLNEAFMSCQMIAMEAQQFYPRYQAYNMLTYSSTMMPTQKINGAFQRYSKNNELIGIQNINDTVSLIVDAFTVFVNAFTKAYNAVPKNHTLVARYQKCAKTFMSEFDDFVKLLNQEYPQYFNQNINFARVDDLLVDIFSGWSDLYSGIAGCCSLAKNRNGPSPSPPTTPPKMADKYLDGDALVIQCLDQVHENHLLVQSKIKDIRQYILDICLWFN